MMFGRKLRACEILAIWQQHHGIEQFWRALKAVLQIRQMDMMIVPARFLGDELAADRTEPLLPPPLMPLGSVH